MVFAIGTDGKLYPLKTTILPEQSPSPLLSIPPAPPSTSSTITLPPLPASPRTPTSIPVPARLIVYPINTNGSLGTALSIGAANYCPVQCFPTNLTVTPNGNFVYVTNTNAVVVTTSPPVTGTVPMLPASCPSSGTVSAFSVTASAVTPVAGSPFSTGSASEPTGILADPRSGSLYVTDSALNQLYTYSIQSSGALSLTSTVATGTMPMGATIVPAPPPRSFT